MRSYIQRQRSIYPSQRKAIIEKDDKLLEALRLIFSVYSVRKLSKYWGLILLKNRMTSGLIIETLDARFLSQYYQTDPFRFDTPRGFQNWSQLDFSSENCFQTQKGKRLCENFNLKSETVNRMTQVRKYYKDLCVGIFCSFLFIAISTSVHHYFYSLLLHLHQIYIFTQLSR